MLLESAYILRENHIRDPGSHPKKDNAPQCDEGIRSKQEHRGGEGLDERLGDNRSLGRSNECDVSVVGYKSGLSHVEYARSLQDTCVRSYYDIIVKIPRLICKEKGAVLSTKQNNVGLGSGVAI